MSQRFLFLFICFFFFTACSEHFTDIRDGQTYKVVKIGELTWMSKNLNYKSKNSVCPEDDERNCSKYGRLYRFKDALNICPDGWRLPTKTDFEKLIQNDPNHIGKALKAKNGWFKKGNGDNASGFNALPAGFKNGDRIFNGLGGYAYFWSSTVDSLQSEFAVYLFLNFYSDEAELKIYSKSDSRSVRCVK